MCKIKKSIAIDILFDELHDELKFIYKSIIKLDFDEKPDYSHYILLLENILKNKNVFMCNYYDFSFYKKMKCFIQENKLNNPKSKLLSNNFFIFEGYPINISY